MTTVFGIPSRATSSGRSSVRRSSRGHSCVIALGCLLLLPSSSHPGGTVTECTEASLRATMSGGGVVSFACDGTIYLSRTISNTLDTVLDGIDHQVIISGSNAVRLFYVATNSTLTAVNLTFADGFSRAGSAILNAGGKVILTGVTLRTNVATQTGADVLLVVPGAGGAIFNQAGIVEATNCFFAGNRARNFDVSGLARGGAIRNESGQVTLEHCNFLANQVEGGAALYPQVKGNDAFGGAVDNSGTLAIDFCTFSQNSAAAGGGYNNYGTSGGMAAGGAVYNLGVLSFGRSTCASNGVTGGNGGSGYKGGVFMDIGLRGGDGAAGGSGQGGALFNNGTASVINCTIVGSTGRGGNGGAGGQGGGPYVRYGGNGGNGGSGGNGSGGVYGTVNLVNCTVAWNAGFAGSGGAAGAGGGGLVPGAPGIPGTSGLASGGTGSSAAVNTLIASNSPPGNDSFSDPKLGPLADNGGPTLTMALLPGSPAIDAGDTDAAPATDQRGFPRPAGAAVDIGAFENGSVMPTLACSRSGETGFNIIGSGNTGQVCRLLASTNLVFWTPVATNRIGTDGSVQFYEDFGSFACRFYRLAMP
jgi:hypothetical protein